MLKNFLSLTKVFRSESMQANIHQTIQFLSLQSCGDQWKGCLNIQGYDT